MRPRVFISIVAGTAASASIAQTPVQVVRGQMCQALVPAAGYAFTGENPAGAAFGADLVRHDRAVAASYMIVGADAAMRSSTYYGRYYATPHQAALAMLSSFGKVALQCAAPVTIGPNLQLMQCRTPQYVGVAIYQTFSMPANGYVVVIRSAGTLPALWAREGEIAASIARSIRCNVPLRPSTADWTSSSSGSGKSRRPREGDSEYSRWLGREHYHNPRTGENFWVSPSSDWRDTGPQGPGYYIRRGNDTIRLEPGRG